MSTNVLQVLDVHKSFKGVQVLSGINLALNAGQRHVIFGPNGAGKTTLFNIITGQVSADRGDIRFLGQNMNSLPVHQRVREGLVRTQQITSVFRLLTLGENISLALQSQTKAPVSMLRRRDGTLGVGQPTVEAVLDRWGWRRRRDAVVASLPYGEQRRLEIAVALVQNPRVLLLDEPMAGLTEPESEQIAEIIAGLDPEVAVLLIEHHVSLALKIADEVSVMHHGVVIASGTPQHIAQEKLVQDVYLGVAGRTA